MTGHRPFAELRREMHRRNPTRKWRVTAAMKALREWRGVTQVDLAAALNTTQPAVSRTERQTDVHVLTLRSYVEALGGHLRVIAEFPDGSFDVLGAAGSDTESGERP